MFVCFCKSLFGRSYPIYNSILHTQTQTNNKINSIELMTNFIYQLALLIIFSYNFFFLAFGCYAEKIRCVEFFIHLFLPFESNETHNHLLLLIQPVAKELHLVQWKINIIEPRHSSRQFKQNKKMRNFFFRIWNSLWVFKNETKGFSPTYIHSPLKGKTLTRDGSWIHFTIKQFHVPRNTHKSNI